MILLNPGPTNILQEVSDAHSKNTDVCHRTEEFLEVYQGLKDEILQKFAGTKKDDFEVALIAGSGTSALEAMITSVVPNETLLINAGKYGERARKILEVNKVTFSEVTCRNYTELKKDTNCKDLYFVENETTTGEKFSLDTVTRLYPEARLYIDATSAFGATDYDYYLDNIQALSFCSNKCLQAPAGLAVVIYRKDSHIFHRGSYTLNLDNYKNQMPFTIPPQLVNALRTSIGISPSFSDVEQNFNTRKNRLIEDFNKIGITCLNKEPSNSIIGFRHPRRSYENLRDFLEQEGIIIYSGIENIRNSFRVSTMSSLFDEKYETIMEAFRDSCIS